MVDELVERMIEIVEEQGLWDDPEDEPDVGEQRSRRSAADLEATKERIVAELAEQGEPVAIGVVAEALGTTSRRLSHPMRLLVDEGRVSRSGERRGARYQLPARKRQAKRRPRKKRR